MSLNDQICEHNSYGATNHMSRLVDAVYDLYIEFKGYAKRCDAMWKWSHCSMHDYYCNRNHHRRSIRCRRRQFSVCFFLVNTLVSLMIIHAVSLAASFIQAFLLPAATVFTVRHRRHLLLISIETCVAAATATSAAASCVFRCEFVCFPMLFHLFVNSIDDFYY